MLKTTKTLMSAAILAFGLAQPAAAASGLLYECDITDRVEKVDWLSPKLAVILPAKGQPQVYDSIILHFFGKPVPAKVTKRGDDLIARWTLKGVRDSNEQLVPHFDYTARIDTKTMRVHLAANPVQFPNRWTGKGTCKTRTK